MKNSNNYHDETAKENILQLRKLQEELPRFCRQYFPMESNRRPRPARGLPMRMTSVSFLSFCTKITACFRRWIS